ncbi:S8 family serine peptidase [Pseudoalteromonas sp. MMG012]|uniref:S8 family serine peptidase n=1 Tax=Pseudoalteromonas sp. MMG012 TaxID=2822686 RepID=UPI001B3A21BF|nr:S8 family serine peptidase [Pseudoalteromonas sp. MMG012]MBQ4852664.1 S8 family serine peptidase [Pseudoalteromonas sp. MMG012]
MFKIGKLGVLSAAVLVALNTQATTDRDYENRWLDPNGDPLLALQWNLLNKGTLNGTTAGIDLNLWQSHIWGHKGHGVTVAVIDSGVDMDHPDLTDNLIKNPDVDSRARFGSHGTKVAGIIAATQNQIGVRGVAPQAKVISYYGSGGRSFDEWRVSHGDHESSKNIRAFNKSYGVDWAMSVPYTHEGAELNYPGMERVFEKVSLITKHSDETVADERTAIFVQAAGNGYQGTALFETSAEGPRYIGAGWPIDDNAGLPWQNSNADYESANFWNLPVSAISADGVLSSYSTVGSSIFLTAPGGNDRFTPGHTTTTFSCEYYKRAYPDIVTDCSVLDNDGIEYGYSHTMSGTSSAAPNTVGAIALMLSAADQQQHNLTARDIRHLLAQTATKVDRARSEVVLNGSVALESWTKNAANVEYSPIYGFGLPDIDKAVELIRRYAIENLPSELVKTPWYGIDSKNLSIGIADDSTPATAEIDVQDDLYIEAVQVRLDIDHTRLSDLKIELESPNGTRSILMSPYNNLVSRHIAEVQNQPLTEKYRGYRDHLMLSYKFWDEKANAVNGKWTLHVTDVSNQTRSINWSNDGVKQIPLANNKTVGVINNWSLRVIGHKNKVTKKKSL